MKPAHHLLKNILSALFLFFYLLSPAQNQSFAEISLKRIRQQQVSADPHFLRWAFPSYVSKSKRYNETQPDNNVFFNALISYTLKSLRAELSPADQLIVDSIAAHNQFVFSKYKNSKGRNTYNFARTDTTFIFPFNNWIPKLRDDLQFPDDLDCTSLVLLCQDLPDSTARQAHTLMQEYVNKGKLKTTFRSYRKYPAYSAWYGKKFPVVFDVSVLCNILSFVQENNLPWTKADSASLRLIVKTVKQNDHKKHPLFVSPYYGKESLILYHLARLMSIKPIAELEELKPKLATDASYVMAASRNTMEKVMLNSALMKWGYEPNDILSKSEEQLIKEAQNSDFSFFVGNIPSYRRQPWKELLTDLGIMQYHYYCNAFNDALLTEYFVLKSRKQH
jgi:hypothetical protein